MTEEKDSLADYFHDPDEEYREYKRKKREKERLEREREEAQHSDNEQSEEEDVCEGIIDPIGDLDPEVEAYIESLDTNEDEEDFEEEAGGARPFYEGFGRSEQEIRQDYDAQLRSNKAVIELNRLHENMSNPEFADDVYDLEQMEIYMVDSATESLNEAVRFSRYRRSKGSLIKHDESNEWHIKEFLDSSYTSRGNEAIFHKFNYPEDYLWADNGWEVRYCEHIYTSKDEPICTGNHWCDHNEVDVEDIDTWPFYNHEIVDVDVEMELSFQKLLDKLMPVIGDGGFCMDINLQIPYSQLAKASTFEIRLIAFLIAKNIKPRVSITIRNRDADISDKACCYLLYLKITKKHQ